MAELTLDIARRILDAVLATAIEKNLEPIVITILDALGSIKLHAAQDGTSLMRGEIAYGKAYGALSTGMGSDSLLQPAEAHVAPVPGGVLIQDGTLLLGALGVSGDTADNETACAIAAIEAVGLTANAG